MTGQVGRPEQVGAQDAVEDVDGYGLERPVGDHPRRVDHGVEPALALQGPTDGAGHGRVVADVDGLDAGPGCAEALALVGDLGERHTVAGDEHQVSAGASCAERDRAPDAARRARHHQDGRGSVHGRSTTFTQPSFFCWNIS